MCVLDAGAYSFASACLATIQFRMHSLHYPQVRVAIVDLVTFLKFNLLSIARFVSGCQTKALIGKGRDLARLLHAHTRESLIFPSPLPFFVAGVKSNTIVTAPSPTKILVVFWSNSCAQYEPRRRGVVALLHLQTPLALCFCTEAKVPVTIVIHTSVIVLAPFPFVVHQIPSVGGQYM